MRLDTWKQLAGRTLSHILNPIVISVPLLLMVGVEQGVDLRQSFRTILLVVGIATVLPTVYTLAILHFGLIDDIFITNRKQRIYFLPVVLACLGMSGIILYRSGAPRIILVILLASTITLGVASFITVWYKISLHMTGIAALTACFITVYGEAALPMLILLPLTAWARLTIREHTLSEVVSGTLLGLSMTAAVIAFLG